MNRFRIIIICLIMGCCSFGLKAQNPVNALKDTVAKNVQGVIDNSAQILVGGDPSNVQNNKGDKSGDVSQTGDNMQPDGHGVGAGNWPSDYPKIIIDFEEFGWENIGDVYDGIFYVKLNGRSNTYRFYRVKNATQVGHSEWYAIQNPRFDHGVCAVRSCKPYSGDPEKPYTCKYRWYILKSNGDSIALDPSITQVTNFYDGLAVASTGPYNERFYINDRGQKVYPHIKLAKSGLDFKNYPLTEGTRRLFKGDNNKFGYMDATGRVVIEPKYEKARNFSSGYALVYDYQNTERKWWVINTLGEKISEVPDKYKSFTGAAVTSFINSTAMAHNDETDQVDIVNQLMQVKATYDKSSGFFLKNVPPDAAIAIVSNSGWEHPKFCTTTGELVKDQEYPYGPYSKYELTDPEISSYPDCQEDPANVNNQLGWHNTGYWASHHTLIGDTDVVYNYKGVVWEYRNSYNKVRQFCAEGYSPGIKYSTANWHQQGLTGDWVQELKEHYVYFDTEGKVLLEFVLPEEKKD